MSYKRCPQYPIVATLRRTRVERNLSQQDVAEAMGYARTTLGFWESHRRLPSLPALDDWCAALGVESPLSQTADIP